ncbi:pirin [hydrocarbon metagenome]|uniref:Pirin n=1 Tax=hydrocarbon metagenome TaxID=938273 RepID=A0A0W8FYW3_9ZZZZ
MIQIHKSENRGKTHIDWLESYHSFSFGHYYDPDNIQFGPIRVLNDDIIAPGAGFPTHPHNNMEIVTISLEGELAHEDSTGGKGVIRPGEVQRMTAGKGVYHSEFNNSNDKPAHILQIWFIPDKAGYEPSYEQKKYNQNDAKNSLLKLVSKKEGDGIVTINQDADLYLSELEKENTIKHKISDGRGVYLFLIDGLLKVIENEIKPRDAVKVSEENELTITAKNNAIFILFDVSLN